MNIFIQLSKLVFIFFMFVFTADTAIYIGSKDKKRRRRRLRSQGRIIFLMTLFAFGILFAETESVQIAVIGGALILLDVIVMWCFHAGCRGGSTLLLHTMLFLLNCGLIMTARINPSQAVKQMIIACGGLVLYFIVPVIIKHAKGLRRFGVLYAVAGILMLGAVFAMAAVSGGAKLSIEIAGITFQLSEIAKITFAFYLAGSLSKDTSFKNICVTTVVAALHVGILVLSTDLGGAFVFFAAYLAVLYASTGKARYAAAGLAAGAGAAVVSYKLFGHVRQRVAAWKDPFAVYDSSGYQIVQGLFAVGSGGWFGTGLGQGRPGSIPVATKDFMFAAITEEFGVIFAIGLILLCFSLFLIINNISSRLDDPFYKILAFTLGAEYAVQCFLTIGGVTGLIPMTGITLPLVSYGGSSVIATMLMISVVEGMYRLKKANVSAEGEGATE